MNEIKKILIQSYDHKTEKSEVIVGEIKDRVVYKGRHFIPIVLYQSRIRVDPLNKKRPKTIDLRRFGINNLTILKKTIFLTEYYFLSLDLHVGKALENYSIAVDFSLKPFWENQQHWFDYKMDRIFTHKNNLIYRNTRLVYGEPEDQNLDLSLDLNNDFTVISNF